MAKAISLLLFLSGCAGFSVVKKTNVRKNFCTISGNDIICSRVGKDGKRQITSKFAQSEIKDLDGWVAIPMQTFQELAE